MDLTGWFSLISLMVSIIAVLLTLRFNQQQQKLNDFLLKKEQNDAESSRKADVSASFIPWGTRKHRLKIFNKGKSPAHNVRIEFPEGTGSVQLGSLEGKFPMEILEPGQSVEIVAFVFIGRGTVGKIPVKTIWSDAYQEVNEKISYATI